MPREQARSPQNRIQRLREKDTEQTTRKAEEFSLAAFMTSLAPAAQLYSQLVLLDKEPSSSSRPTSAQQLRDAPHPCHAASTPVSPFQATLPASGATGGGPSPPSPGSFQDSDIPHRLGHTLAL